MGLTLNDLKVKESGKITGYGDIDKSYRNKLLAMGLTRGTEFTISRMAPLGDPIEIKIKEYNLSLRKDEAKAILVEKT